MNKQKTKICLVSSCLVGLCSRYDGRIKSHLGCMQQLDGIVWIPVCPEQLGGLPTPRVPAEIIGGSGKDVLAGKAKVITRNGEDVTFQFIKGAKQVLTIAMSQPVNSVFLKAGSPSCGVTTPQGVTAALLSENGYTIREF